RPMPIARAISSAGGVMWDDIADDYALKRISGCFVAGEMIDWEAPTGGYLLQACLATGKAAAHGALEYLKRACVASRIAFDVLAQNFKLQPLIFGARKMLLQLRKLHRYTLKFVGIAREQRRILQRVLVRQDCFLQIRDDFR